MNYNQFSTDFTTIGYVAFWICASIIAIYWGTVLFSFISKREIVERQRKWLTASFVVSLIIWALLWDPAPYYDSYKHFIWLDQIRSQGGSLFKFLSEGIVGSRYGNYPGLIAFNILRYIVAVISEDNHFLPMICTAIVYTLVFYIVQDYFKKKELSCTWLFPCLTMVFSYLPYFMVVSGIRNALGASIAAYAIYKRIFKNKNLLYYFTISLIAVTVHPNVLLALVIGLVYPFFKGFKSIFILFAGALFLMIGVNYFQSSNVFFLSYIGNTISFYLNEGKYSGEMVTYIVDIVTLICTLFLLYINRRDLDEGNNDGLQFCIVYMVVCIATAFVGGTNFLTRSCYVLGPLIVFIIEPFSSCGYSIRERNGVINWIIMATIIVTSTINIGQGFLLLLAQFF